MEPPTPEEEEWMDIFYYWENIEHDYPMWQAARIESKMPLERYTELITYLRERLLNDPA